MDKRRRLFWIITLLLPVIALVAFEFNLRMFHYGGNLDLVITKEILGKTYFTLNPDVGRRYFSQEGISIPEPHDDVFETVKPAATKRIFMLGESTMAGFPYDYNATPPSLLRDELRAAYPSFNFEVINCGLSAVNSYTVDEFARELLQYQPDAFIVYLGHNEFYGALGVGSTEYLGRSRTLIHWYLRLQDLRVFRMVRDVFLGIRRFFQPDAVPGQATLMESMVRTSAIRYRSDEYNIARENLAKNLEDIADAAGHAHVPIIFSTLASNIRDQRPLYPVFAAGTGEAAQEDWKSALKAGSADMERGEFAAAVPEFMKAIGVDSCNADAHYFLARCLDTLGRYDSARAEYERARDEDGMRFRAAGDINTLLREVCRENSIPCCDAESAFAAASPHGLVGHNLMFEHLHPTFAGYRLLASSFFETLRKHSVIAPASQVRWDRLLSDAHLRDSAGVTRFEEEAASFRIFSLTHAWPFVSASAPRPQFTPVDEVESLAVRYVHKEVAWSTAHYTLGDRFVRQAHYDSARAEYYAVAKVIPYSTYPLMMLGDMERLMNRFGPAEESYRNALKIQESPFIHVRLGMMYFDRNEIDRSITEFEKTLQLEAGDRESMNERDRSMSRFFLGAAYGRKGNIPKAKMYLQLAVEIDPDNQDAKKMLAQIP
jgi:tetratricopeptide (TPR) repeat protein